MEKYTNKINTAIFISGNGSNMKRIIEESQNGILRDTLTIKIVFSDNRFAKGLKIAEKLGISTFYTKQYYKNRKRGEEKILLKLREYNIELIILAGYMRILSSSFVNKYEHRIINIHPADNDVYKGKHGYEWAYNNKLEYSFITIHLVNEYIDSGRVLTKEYFLIPKGTSLKEIKKNGLNIEHEIYSKVIKNYVLEELL